MPDDRPVSPEEHDERESAYENGYEHGRRDEREAAIEAGVFRFGAYATPAALSTPAGPSPEPAGIYDAEPAEPSEWSAPREEAVEALAVLDEARRQIMDEIRAGERRIDAAHLHHIDSFIRRVRRLSAARPSSPASEETWNALASGEKRIAGEDDLLRRIHEWTNAPSNTPSAPPRSTPGDDATTKEGR